MAGHAPGRLTVFRRRAASPWIRSFLRLLTVVWGLVTLGDAALNVYLAFHVSISTFLAVAPSARYAIMGGAFLWTMTHAHRGRYLAHLFAA